MSYSYGQQLACGEPVWAENLNHPVWMGICSPSKMLVCSWILIQPRYDHRPQTSTRNLTSPETEMVIATVPAPVEFTVFHGARPSWILSINRWPLQVVFVRSCKGQLAKRASSSLSLIRQLYFLSTSLVLVSKRTHASAFRTLKNGVKLLVNNKEQG